MRTNNSKVKNTIISVYFILIVLVIMATTFLSYFEDLYENPTLTVFGIIAVFAFLFFMTHRNAKYFEYDSDGAKVVILNKGLLLAEHFNYREYKVEFLKERLEGYRFKNLIFYRSLTVLLKERNDDISAYTFNITLLTRKKRRYIRQSLSKMVKLNKRQNIVDGRT